MENLNERLILESTSEVEIFRKYFKQDFVLNRSYLSPLREENNPSFSIFKGSRGTHELLYKDWGLDSVGSCFKFVQLLYNIDYHDSLHKIAYDFNISTEEVFFYNSKYIPVKSNKIIPEKEKAAINFDLLQWNPITLDYWQQYDITEEILRFYNVYPVKNLYINNKLADSFTRDLPIYIYTFLQDDKKIGFKVYRPYRSKLKFLRKYDSSVIEGINQARLLKEHVNNTLIITKSLKDVMCLFSAGFLAISPPSETATIPETLLLKLKAFYKHIFVLFDNDHTGIIKGKKLSEEYNLNYLCIDIDDTCKDFSDCCKRYGVINAKKWLLDKLNSYYD